ncbi:competence protein ComJ [Xanthomonas sacchari]|uniref:competence protein ComJ n=1 Tax=Xanthomonas sacchari TaxID=56458 RepID=UPI003B21D0B2
MEDDDARRDTGRGSVDFHSQLQLRARAFDEAACRWGPRNLEQGAILHRDYVVFDPLPEDAFGAQVHLVLAAAFAPDPRAQRRMLVPFRVNADARVQVASAAEAFDATLALQPGDYALYYEVCEGDEVYYRLTLVPATQPVTARYLLDDPWGGAQDAPLQDGTL